MKDLRITLVQATLTWENPSENRQRFQELLLPLSGKTDLIILPEMFTTGFSMNPAPLAEPMDGPTVQWLTTMAHKTGAVLTGSFIAKANNSFFNRLVWARPDGTYTTYDKRHLFSFANEHQHYSSGHQHLLEEWKGWKILPLICYDLRFPVWSRNTQGYDLLIYVANWPQKRSYAWTSLLTARAIENQAYTVGVNRVGIDGNGIAYSGDSRLIDYSGAPILTAAHQEQVLTATLSRDQLVTFRDRFRFLQDQDDFRFL
jgi:omega-amidase